MAQLNIGNQSACLWIFLAAIDWRFSVQYSVWVPFNRSDTNAADEPAKMSFYRHLSAMPDHGAM